MKVLNEVNADNEELFKMGFDFQVLKKRWNLILQTEKPAFWSYSIF